jgi:AbrB family looped-hinge helix DNA binding protein
MHVIMFFFDATYYSKHLTYARYFGTVKPRYRMETVKVSPKFQVVIPKRLREELELKPGEELQIFLFEKSLRLQRPRSIKDLRGIAKGMVWKDEDRDHSDRF